MAMQTPGPADEGGETQKRKKHRGENFTVPLPTSVQVMGHFLDKGGNPSLQGHTADIRRQRNLSRSPESEYIGLKLITYSRRSSKDGHMRKKKNQNTSQENLQKNVSHNENSSTVKPAETGFCGKKNNDASFRESFLGIRGKEVGPMRDSRQGDLASTVSTYSNQNKARFLDSNTIKFTRRWWGRKGKNKTSSNARQVSASEQRENVSKESANIASVKNGDLHPEILSKFDMEKENNINQRMSVKQDSSAGQIKTTIITVNKSDLHPRHSPKIPAVKGSSISTSSTRTSKSSSGEVHLSSPSSFPESGQLRTTLGLSGSVEKFSQPIEPDTFVNLLDYDNNLGTARVAMMTSGDLPAPGIYNNAVPPFVQELSICNMSLAGISVVDSLATSRAEAEIVPRRSEIAPEGVAPRPLLDRHDNPRHNAAPAEPLISGLTAEASGVVVSPPIEIAGQIVGKSPSVVAPHVESTHPVVYKEGGVAERESMAIDAQAVLGLGSTPTNISPLVSSEGPSAAEPECRVTSSLANRASKASQSFPALGIEWPDGPQFGVALGSPEVAAKLVQSLDLLLQVDPLPTVEAMRSKLEECTRGYHAFGLHKDTWMAKLAAVWDEFTHLHAIQEQRQRTKMMLQQEEELLCRLQATQAEVSAQVEAARERGWKASLRVAEIQREVRTLLKQVHVAKDECNRAQAEAETLRCGLDRLRREALLSMTRIADLKKNGS